MPEEVWIIERKALDSDTWVPHHLCMRCPEAERRAMAYADYLNGAGSHERTGSSWEYRARAYTPKQ
jgi:hypothetical protein